MAPREASRGSIFSQMFRKTKEPKDLKDLYTTGDDDDDETEPDEEPLNVKEANAPTQIEEDQHEEEGASDELEGSQRRIRERRRQRPSARNSRHISGRSSANSLALKLGGGAGGAGGGGERTLEEDQSVASSATSSSRRSRAGGRHRLSTRDRAMNRSTDSFLGFLGNEDENTDDAEGDPLGISGKSATDRLAVSDKSAATTPGRTRSRYAGERLRSRRQMSDRNLGGKGDDADALMSPRRTTRRYQSERVARERCTSGSAGDGADDNSKARRSESRTKTRSSSQSRPRRAKSAAISRNSTRDSKTLDDSSKRSGRNSSTRDKERSRSKSTNRKSRGGDKSRSQSTARMNTSSGRRRERSKSVGSRQHSRRSAQSVDRRKYNSERKAKPSASDRDKGSSHEKKISSHGRRTSDTSKHQGERKHRNTKSSRSKQTSEAAQILGASSSDVLNAETKDEPTKESENAQSLGANLNISETLANAEVKFEEQRSILGNGRSEQEAERSHEHEVSHGIPNRSSQKIPASPRNSIENHGELKKSTVTPRNSIENNGETEKSTSPRRSMESSTNPSKSESTRSSMEDSMNFEDIAVSQEESCGSSDLSGSGPGSEGSNSKNLASSCRSSDYSNDESRKFSMGEVLQFDPTQAGLVQRVKQITSDRTDYEINGQTGQIGEIVDTVSSLQLNHKSTPLFDLLDDNPEIGDLTEAETMLSPGNRRHEYRSSLRRDKSQGGDDADREKDNEGKVDLTTDILNASNFGYNEDLAAEIQSTPRQAKEKKKAMFNELREKFKKKNRNRSNGSDSTEKDSERDYQTAKTLKSSIDNTPELLSPTAEDKRKKLYDMLSDEDDELSIHDSSALANNAPADKEKKRTLVRKASGYLHKMLNSSASEFLGTAEDEKSMASSATSVSKSNRNSLKRMFSSSAKNKNKGRSHLLSDTASVNTDLADEELLYDEILKRT